MAVLTDEIKVFIVKALARYDTPSQVAEAVKANFGVDVTRHQVHEYDADCSRPPAQRWRDLHAATRQAFLREIAEIGIVHKATRLRMLDRLAHQCEQNSVAQTLSCLEQAAKECGGFYEKRRHRDAGKDGPPHSAVPAP
jgi:hypothetical protein